MREDPADIPPRGTCTRPPEGWWCELDEGHDGSCPAREDDAVVDYKALLAKYILHVGYEEGETYVNRAELDGEVKFTQAELDALAAADDKARAEEHRRHEARRHHGG